jgi:hypothetical protein
MAYEKDTKRLLALIDKAFQEDEIKKNLALSGYTKEFLSLMLKQRSSALWNAALQEISQFDNLEEKRLDIEAQLERALSAVPLRLKILSRIVRSFPVLGILLIPACIILGLSVGWRTFLNWFVTLNGLTITLGILVVAALLAFIRHVLDKSYEKDKQKAKQESEERLKLGELKQNAEDAKGKIETAVYIEISEWLRVTIGSILPTRLPYKILMLLACRKLSICTMQSIQEPKNASSLCSTTCQEEASASLDRGGWVRQR